MSREKDFFAQMYMDNYGAMLKYAAAALKNEEQAQDVVQQAFLIAYERLDNLVDSPQPRGWLFSALKNVIGNYFKKKERLEKLVEETEGHATDEEDVFLKYRGAISDNDLKLLIDIYCDGVSYAEAARERNISLSALKKRVQRASERFENIF